ncbi:hypothetical protein [Amycolatopsis jiangsuensis]|uniref:Uncharacterized protein n=1 Tax=Amycolatopsis jiangsuensis TaxID=1181879 RepID=A0A840IUK7_9PSEU|nr:hypothetical protein [Amycolatopsis jiangsuensis]MBB4686371.1 hypothetical protein [Amycolatopsis jiangsuensis]
MAENPYSYDEPKSPARRGGVDVVTLVVGIATLLVSGYVLTDGASWLPTFDFRWIVAGGAVFIGVLMLASSFGRRRR